MNALCLTELSAALLARQGFTVLTVNSFIQLMQSERQTPAASETKQGAIHVSGDKKISGKKQETEEGTVESRTP